MDEEKIKILLKKINELNSKIKDEQILSKIIEQIVYLQGQIVETEKYSDVVSQLNLIKKNVNNIYLINVTYLNLIKEIYTMVKDSDTTKNSFKRHSTFEKSSKYTEDFVIIQNEGKDLSDLNNIRKVVIQVEVENE